MLTIEELERIETEVMSVGCSDANARKLLDHGKECVANKGFYPVLVTKEQLEEVLEDVLRSVEEGDSWEGFINYLLPDDVEQEGFMLEARYRIGNSMGQGGMRMVGEFK